MSDRATIERQIRPDVGSTAEAPDLGSVHWAARRGDPLGAGQTIGMAVFDAGRRNAGHLRPNCEKVALALEGEADHTPGDERIVLLIGALIGVPPASSTAS